MSTSACLTTWLAATRSRPRSRSAAIGPAGGDLGDDQRLEMGEAGELLVDAGLGVVAVDEGVCERQPSIALVGVHAVLGRGRRPAQVPSRHHVGERVVVHRLVVLVGPDDAIDVGRAVALDADA